MKLLSWNVNGLRAVQKKGFAEFVGSNSPDVLCLQEIKALPEQVEPDWPADYHAFWNPAQKKGYSGTLMLTKQEPLNMHLGIGEPEGDAEGRVITAEYDGFYLVTCYTPNSQNELRRLDYRVQTWDIAFREHLQQLDTKKPVVFCGDLNVAHKEIDLANPKTNRRNAGFTDEERESFNQLLEAGFIDTFREFDEGPGNYSWWSYRAGARARNVGWRIDYFGVSERIRDQLQAATILPSVMGSDHCPVGLDLK